MSKIQLRRGTASAWTTANTLLSAGEPGWESDTGKFKIGDGATVWTALAYESGAGGAGVAALVPTAVLAANHTSVASELALMDATAAIRTVTLPGGPPDKTQIGIKAIGLGSGFNVTINAAGADVFDKAGGSASFHLTTPEEMVVLQYQASASIWLIVGHSFSKAQLDLAYGSLSTLTPTVVKATNYTALPGDNVLVDATVATRTITLPTTPVDKTKIGVHLVAQVLPSNCVIACGGTNVFDVAGGFATDTLDTLNQSVVFQFNVATGVWVTIGASIDFDAFSPVAFSGSASDLSGVLPLTSQAAGTTFRVIRNAADTAWTFLGATITTRPTSRIDLYMEAWGGTSAPAFALDGDSWMSA